MRQKLNQSVIHGEAWVSAVEPKYSYDEDVSEDTDLLKERTLLLNVYVRTVQANLESSKFGRDLDYAIADAESEQDSHLKQNPPQGISNAFLLRDYLIAMAKRRRVIGFLKKSIADSIAMEILQLSRLIDDERLMKSFNSA